MRNPDTLLAAIQKEYAQQQRGKLKIYLGMAAGVGKTYAMLENAQQLKAEGKDVVIGYIETHKRVETERLLKGLEIIPRRQIEYHSITLEEMDTDAIIKRQPHLVLVDELAHTNVSGSRHVKRYQDVEEILAAGIHVYTTINVQHFESRADSVQQITGISIRETVPDSILDLANEIELIDLSPEDLQKRLAEGKVYTPDKSSIAAKNFFRIGNLTALREMALRLTAERVDHQLQDYMQIKQIAGPWKSGERLLTVIDANPLAEYLIRWTRRIAYNLESPWLAVYVEKNQLTATEKTLLSNHLQLVRDLGGEFVTISGKSPSHSLLNLAKQRNVTQIIIGKPDNQQKNFFTPTRDRTLVNELIQHSDVIDIHVVANTQQPKDASKTNNLRNLVHYSTFTQYFTSLGIVLTVNFLGVVFWPVINYLAIGLVELMTVLLIAVYIGRGPSLLAATVSAITWDFLFIEPFYTFAISKTEDIILFVLYFITAVFTGNLTSQLREQEQAANKVARRNTALYALMREIAVATNIDDVIKVAIEQIGKIFDAKVAAIVPQGEESKPSLHPFSTLTLTEKELSVGLWAFANGKPAGRFTQTLPVFNIQFIPLKIATRTIGVIGIQTQRQEKFAFDQESLLETFIHQIALVIEHENLHSAAQQSIVLKESEKLYTTLLNSISHELRTPIATILGAASTLLAAGHVTPQNIRKELLQNIQLAAGRLNRLVENLLDMSRLESGRLQIKHDWCDIREIISVAVKNLESKLAEHPLKLDLPDTIPLIKADFALLEQALINLLDNASNYTPPNTPIMIRAAQDNQHIEIRIQDAGPGIPSKDLERIFDKFYRVSSVTTGGTGLGLSISRGLIQAHGGTLTAQNIAGGGVEFIIRLPYHTPPPVKEADL